MEFSSSSVMAYILYKAKKACHPISKTQAQKLLYCCYGIVLAAFDERLTDEHPKAWPGGPLFPRALSAINRHRLTTDMAEIFIASCPADWLKLMDKTSEIIDGSPLLFSSRWLICYQWLRLSKELKNVTDNDQRIRR